VLRDSECLKKLKVSVSDSLVDTHELTADKLESEGDTFLQVSIKEEEKLKIHEIQTLSCKINDLIHELKKMTDED